MDTLWVWGRPSVCQPVLLTDEASVVGLANTCTVSGIEGV